MTTLQAVRPMRVSRRPSASTIAIVAALHLVIIYGLYLGLTNHWSIPVPKGPITIIPVQDANHPPPKPSIPVKMVNPRGSTAIKPVIQIEDNNSNSGIRQTYVPDAGPASPAQPPVLVAAEAITPTHTIPPYPPIAVRLNQTGNVELKLQIDEYGNVTEAAVEKSSGYESLDNAAIAWVVAHWRYEPATRDGKPIASTMNAKVTFRLTGGRFE